jgi:hypothetical protein
MKSLLLILALALTPNLLANLSSADVQKAANAIDKLVLANLQAHKMKPNPIVDDAVFLRRTYLQIIGRIPSLPETKEFLESRSPDKRTKLVSKLLGSYGYVSHHFNYWADILRAKSDLPGTRRGAGEPYVAWIKQAVDENKPYDQMVREMITSHGDTWHPDAGASGFYRRDYGMPLDHFAITMQIFTGTQLACAQCHDHPFDKWKQKQFFEMAAFTWMPRQSNPATGQDMRGVEREILRKFGRNWPENLKPIKETVDYAFGRSVPDEGRGWINLPHDYAYDDAKPKEKVMAKTSFGPEVEYEEGNPKNSREVFAEWLTSAENPRFTTVIANRMWKHVMGRGLIEPVDDIRDDTEASNPRLMAYLERVMQAADYDLKQFQEVLYNTQTYQRAASIHDSSDPFHYPGPVLRRMTAPQLWDSLMALKTDHLDRRIRPLHEGYYTVYNTLKDKSTEELVDWVFDTLKKTEGRRVGYDMMAGMNMGAMDYDDETGMSMMMMGGGGGGGKTTGDPLLDKISKSLDIDIARVRNKASAEFALASKLRRHMDYYLDCESKGKTDSMASARKGLEKVLASHKVGNVDKLIADCRASAPASYDGKWVRASELRSPAPAGHFLRKFGAADREYLDNGSREATTPQALELLNGFIDREFVNDKHTFLRRNIDESETAEAKIETLYLSSLNRKPSAGETKSILGYLETAGENGENDLIWALMNNFEFWFIQ